MQSLLIQDCIANCDTKEAYTIELQVDSAVDDFKLGHTPAIFYYKGDPCQSCLLQLEDSL